MKLYYDHIDDCLAQLNNDESEDFCRILKFMNVTDDNVRVLLHYINDLLEFELNFDNQELKYTHIHLPILNAEITLLLFEFIAIKFYFKAFNNKKGTDETNGSFITRELRILDKILRKPLQFGVNTNAWEELKIRNQRRNHRGLKKFYSELSKIDSSLHQQCIPQTIVNSNNNLVAAMLEDHFKKQWFSKRIEDLDLSENFWAPTETSFVVLSIYQRTSGHQPKHLLLY